MTPVKNYQGRNESSVFIALDFEMFLDGFRGHKRGLNFTTVSGNKTPQCFVVNIVPVLESRSRGPERLADWHVVPWPVQLQSRLQNQSGSHVTPVPMAFVPGLPAPPHCLQTLQQTWRVGPGLGVSCFPRSSFHFWLTVVKGSYCLREGVRVLLCLQHWHRSIDHLHSTDQEQIFTKECFLQVNSGRAQNIRSRPWNI